LKSGGLLGNSFDTLLGSYFNLKSRPRQRIDLDFVEICAKATASRRTPWEFARRAIMKVSAEADAAAGDLANEFQAA
jgi:hypothetical protein